MKGTLVSAQLAAQLRVEEQIIEDLCKGSLFQGYYRLNSKFEYHYFNAPSLELLRVRRFLITKTHLHQVIVIHCTCI